MHKITRKELDKTKMAATLDQTRPDQTRPDQSYAQIPVVAVVMSTYNGEKYLSEQIDSILAQKDVHVELFIRDDGSSDSTRNIISDYTRRYGNVHANFGENVGAARSFVQALALASGCEYYAFSDQDDYWESKKLASAVKLIRQNENVQGKNLPILYYSNLNISDSRLNIIRKTKLESRVHSLGSVITRRSLAGCSMVINARLRELIESRSITDDMLAQNHDSFIVSLAYSIGGVVICDAEAYICYRQHGRNVAGSPLSLTGRIQKEWRNLKDDSGIEARIARAILEAYGGEIVPEARSTLETVAGYRENIISRLNIVFSPEFRTGDFRLTLLGKVKALFGLL